MVRGNEKFVFWHLIFEMPIHKQRSCKGSWVISIKIKGKVREWKWWFGTIQTDLLLRMGLLAKGVRINTEVRGLSLFVKIPGRQGASERKKEWPVRKEVCCLGVKWRKNFKKQVLNWICLFICFLIKQDAKGLVQNEHQDYIV